MGFPNVDLILKDLFLAEFAAVKAAPDFAVEDLFEDRSAGEQAEIKTLISAKTYTDNTRDRGDGKRVFIIPHFPAADLPFPQIGIYSGTVDENDHLLGDYTEPAQAVLDGQGQTIAWDIVKGYWESSAWNVDVVAATKDEAIWFARFCQYFICQNLADLHQKGIVEVGISMTDLRLDKGTMQPMEYFVRGLKIHCRIANTWKSRQPVSYYETGINTAL